MITICCTLFNRCLKNLYGADPRPEEMGFFASSVKRFRIRDISNQIDSPSYAFKADEYWHPSYMGL